MHVVTIETELSNRRAKVFRQAEQERKEKEWTRTENIKEQQRIEQRITEHRRVIEHLETQEDLSERDHEILEYNKADLQLYLDKLSHLLHPPDTQLNLF